MQQNMETTTTAFRIITEELNTIHNEVEFMSKQADEIEASLDDTAKQVNTIFDSFVLHRGDHNRQKRDRSRSVFSRSTGVGTTRRFRKRQQREQELAELELDNVSVVGKSDSDEDTKMSHLTEGNEDEELEVESLVTASDDTKTTDDDGDHPQDASGPTKEAPPLVSRSPQVLGSRRD
jgi:hypothetical protein